MAVSIHYTAYALTVIIMGHGSHCPIQESLGRLKKALRNNHITFEEMDCVFNHKMFCFLLRFFVADVLLFVGFDIV